MRSFVQSTVALLLASAAVVNTQVTGTPTNAPTNAPTPTPTGSPSCGSGSGNGLGSATCGPTASPTSAPTASAMYSLCASGTAMSTGTIATMNTTCTAFAQTLASKSFSSTMCRNNYTTDNSISFGAMLQLAAIDCCGGIANVNPVCGTPFQMCASSPDFQPAAFPFPFGVDINTSCTHFQAYFYDINSTTCGTVAGENTAVDDGQTNFTYGFYLHAVAPTCCNRTPPNAVCGASGSPVCATAADLNRTAHGYFPDGTNASCAALNAAVTYYGLNSSTCTSTVPNVTGTYNTFQDVINAASARCCAGNTHHSACAPATTASPTATPTFVPTTAPTARPTATPFAGTFAPVTTPPTTLSPTGTLPPASKTPTTVAPTGSLAPVSFAPTSVAPTTLAPTESKAPTSFAPTPSLAPVSFAPTTLAPTDTKAPVSFAPTTQAPTGSLAPVTKAPTTIAPTTVAPTTISPVYAPTTSGRLGRRSLGAGQTYAPTSLAPTTNAPTVTDAPVSFAPTTVAPTGSLAPVSNAPTTLAPTGSLAPVSFAPTTLSPTITDAPVSYAPTTQAPTDSLAPVSFAPTTVAPTASLAPSTVAPTSIAPTTPAPTIPGVHAFPTAAPVSGTTTQAPTLAPQDESNIQATLTTSQSLSSMTDAEKASLKHNALVKIVERLNNVNAGNGQTLTTSNATRVTLSATASRRGRRSNTIFATAFFPVAVVTGAEATSAAATITSGNPLVVSYTKADSSVATATATTASAAAGTAAPTPAPTVAGATSSSKDKTTTAIIVVCVLGVFFVTFGLVAWKVLQDKKNNADGSGSKTGEPSEPHRLETVAAAGRTPMRNSATSPMPGAGAVEEEGAPGSGSRQLTMPKASVV